MESQRPDDGIIKLIPGRFSAADLQCGGAAGGGGGGLSGATVASPNQLHLSRGIDRVGRVG